MLILNPNIICTKQDSYYYLEDRGKKVIYRIGEVEYSVLSYTIKRISISEINKKLHEENGVEFQVEKLLEFQKNLYKYGILVQNHKKIAFKILSYISSGLDLRIPLINPSLLFNRLKFVNVIKHIYTIPWATVFCIVIILGLILFISNSSECFNLSFLFNEYHYIPLFLVFFLISTLLHESAHAMTHIFFGGEVKEIGIGVFLLVPSIYCSLDNYYKITKRYQKILIYLSGLLMDLFMCSFLVIIYNLLPQLNIILSIMKIYLLVVFVRMVFIVNPFIESDCYRILSILIKITNLRSQAITRIFNLFLRKKRMIKNFSKIKQALLIVYGFLFFSFWLGIFSVLILITKRLL